ncbi:MAG: hypothetical protein RSD57_14285 [Comamonas sp.]
MSKKQRRALSAELQRQVVQMIRDQGLRNGKPIELLLRTKRDAAAARRLLILKKAM